MKAVFADTSFFLASLNPADQLHEQAIALSREIAAPRLTTGFVLLEVANAMRRGMQRTQFVEFHSLLKEHPLARIIPVSPKLFDRGDKLFASRPDKDWSLTDRISFIVMSDAGLSEALTHDRHFEQAGFSALLGCDYRWVRQVLPECARPRAQKGGADEGHDHFKTAGADSWFR